MQSDLQSDLKDIFKFAGMFYCSKKSNIDIEI